MLLVEPMCIDFSKHANSGFSAVQIIIYEVIEQSEKRLSLVFGKIPLDEGYVISVLREIAYVLSMDYSIVKNEFDKLVKKGQIHQCMDRSRKAFYIDENFDSKTED